MRTALCVSGVLRRRFPWISWSWRKRKEFLRRGATRRRILARCFGGSLSSSSIFPFFFFSLFLSLSHFVILRVCMCVHACAFGSLSSHSSSPSYISVLFSSSHFFGVPSLWLQLSPSHFYWTRWRNQPHHPSLSPFFLSFAYPAPLSPFFLPCPSLLFATWQSSSW